VNSGATDASSIDRVKENREMKRFGNLRTTLTCTAPMLLVGASLALSGCSKSPESALSSAAPQFMFVQTAEDLKVDPAANTLRLVNVGQQTVYFSDRPVRMAGHIKMAQYLQEWTRTAGKDNFAGDPPNATLSVYEPGQADNTVAVVEIMQPRVEGADLVYDYKLLEGKLPASGGATSLFIDSVGLGGGVGAGYHGVGVGVRGPGVR
jgi:hypothetical protein